MIMAVLTLEKALKTVKNGVDEDRVLLDSVDLAIQPGEFITVVGGNGAGKSTLFNTIAGTLPLTAGRVLINDEDVTRKSEEDRAKYIARVFQDPKMGTAPRMTVAENLLLAEKRGQRRMLIPRKISERKAHYVELCRQIGNGLENHLETPTGNLSGGQRQALSLLMATLADPELLLLDEHTAALDPKTSKNLMSLTNEIVTSQKRTCMMITHHMEDALNYGDRLILMKKGQIAKDLNAAEKAALTLPDLLLFFEDDI